MRPGFVVLLRRFGVMVNFLDSTAERVYTENMKKIPQIP